MTETTKDHIYHKALEFVLGAFSIDGLSAETFKTESAITSVVTPTKQSYGRIYGAGGKTWGALRRLTNLLGVKNGVPWVLVLGKQKGESCETTLDTSDDDIIYITNLFAGTFCSVRSVDLIDIGDGQIIIQIVSDDVESSDSTVQLERLLKSIVGTTGREAQVSWVKL